MGRIRIKPSRLKEEKSRVYQFTFDCVRPMEGKYFFIHDAYDTYKLWCLEMGHDETELSVDGFGRLFPGCYKRKLLNRDGRISRAVIGAEIVW